MDLPYRAPASSSSAAARSAAASPITSRARGERDVVLLERLQLTHGATWHAAGLVGQLAQQQQPHAAHALLGRAVREARSRDGTGHRLARRRQPAARLVAGALARAAALGDDGQGLRLPRRPRHARAKRAIAFPLLDPEGVVGAAWIEGDGYVDPASLTAAYAAGARAGGVRIVQNVRVTGLEQARPPRDARAHGPGRHRCRVRHQRRRHVGARRRRDGRHARRCVRGRASVLRHREDEGDSRGTADAARPRPQLLREAGAGRARGRRVGRRIRRRGATTASAPISVPSCCSRTSIASRRSPRPRPCASRC